MSSVDANPRRASLRLTRPAAGVGGIETFVVRIARELSAAGLDARELATFRQSLDKLKLQLEKRIQGSQPGEVLERLPRERAGCRAPSHAGAFRTIGLRSTNGAS